MRNPNKNGIRLELLESSNKMKRCSLQRDKSFVFLFSIFAYIQYCFYIRSFVCSFFLVVGVRSCCVFLFSLWSHVLCRCRLFSVVVYADVARCCYYCIFLYVLLFCCCCCCWCVRFILFLFVFDTSLILAIRTFTLFVMLFRVYVALYAVKITYIYTMSLYSVCYTCAIAIFVEKYCLCNILVKYEHGECQINDDDGGGGGGGGERRCEPEKINYCTYRATVVSVALAYDANALDKCFRSLLGAFFSQTTQYCMYTTYISRSLCSSSLLIQCTIRIFSLSLSLSLCLLC